ncbi:MAG: hypothetical protein JWQ98_221 [Chlorobi bacterium]|nr:hypothetical protein [Chlorobiota bacterium]
MDLLKRDHAPILEDAWDAIDNEARRVLKLNLAGRKLVDFNGPFGWQFAAVNLGRLELLKHQPVAGVSVGRRRVLPLIELRIPITLDMMELDSVARGATDPDLGPVVEAAEKIARAEDSAIFNGYHEAGIRGIIESSPHAPLNLPARGADYPKAIVQAKEILREAGINGPYALAVGPRVYEEISRASEDGYPIRKRIEQQMIDGPIVWAPSIQGAVLMSMRGGDFELTVGQDLSIGYAYHEKHTVELYLTESFTFRVLEPAAAIYLRHEETKPAA